MAHCGGRSRNRYMAEEEVVSRHEDVLLGQPHRDRVHCFAGRVQELQSHAGNCQRQLVSAERARGRQVAVPSGRRDPSEFHLNARVDEHRVRQRHTELVAAVAPGAADIRHRLEEASGGRAPVRFVGRPWRASPSEGYPTSHLREQDRIVRAALAATGG